MGLATFFTKESSEEVYIRDEFDCDCNGRFSTVVRDNNKNPFFVCDRCGCLKGMRGTDTDISFQDAEIQREREQAKAQIALIGLDWGLGR